MRECESWQPVAQWRGGAPRRTARGSISCSREHELLPTREMLRRGGASRALPAARRLVRGGSAAAPESAPGPPTGQPGPGAGDLRPGRGPRWARPGPVPALFSGGPGRHGGGACGGRPSPAPGSTSLHWWLQGRASATNATELPTLIPGPGRAPFTRRVVYRLATAVFAGDSLLDAASRASRRVLLVPGLTSGAREARARPGNRRDGPLTALPAPGVGV